MKHTAVLSYLTMAAMLLSMSACKTTEANYRAAYEAARETRATADDGLDEETRAALQREAQNGPEASSVNTVFFAVTENSDITAPQYCIAVNRFRQQFNAKELCGRLQQSGYYGAFVGKTADQNFYVMLGGDDDFDKASAMLKSSRADKRIPFGSGYPVMIKSAGYYRK